MNIDVIGHQYVWQFKYPGEENVQTYTDMYVPVGMTITLDITSVDVQHSWWIPALAGKQDALPGYTNKSWFKVTEAGEWKGQCAELCGRNHANMLRARDRPAVRRVAGLVRPGRRRPQGRARRRGRRPRRSSRRKKAQRRPRARAAKRTPTAAAARADRWP